MSLQRWAGGRGGGRSGRDGEPEPASDLHGEKRIAMRRKAQTCFHASSFIVSFYIIQWNSSIVDTFGNLMKCPV